MLREIAASRDAPGEYNLISENTIRSRRISQEVSTNFTVASRLGVECVNDEHLKVAVECPEKMAVCCSIVQEIFLLNSLVLGTYTDI